MANFYDPYSKNIQWAQGFADIANQMIMMKMMSKMYGGGGAGAAQGPQNPEAVATGGQATPYQIQGAPNQGPVGMPGEGFGKPMGMAGAGMQFGPETSHSPGLFQSVPMNQPDIYSFLQMHPELAQAFAAMIGGGR